ncbi:hypothetical protein [Chryseobacterium rhizosphaerae]|uniref:Uncharacterized protein n=1 Tax=Chryseobacterium rhizosphaerae TaxID=395937 RepID=A0ABX9IDC0_9FLAO|nr:hypothetical protein [Chryseobacterium rhizosphaerae]REC69224.1 hypothetical protein DRF57_23190 [Chryseobacterium rhizosphaerae]GEN69911.1 hypothetical protein CRH01_44790 [Chryseobacterium rhizosphaerae]
MNLRYIALGLDYDYYSKMNNELRYEFQLHTRYISNYLSKEIRKHKFQTDGTFNMLSISLLPDKIKDTKIVALDVLETYLLFDKSKYEKIKGSDKCDYYLELFEEGFKKANKFKSVPVDVLLSLLKEFKKGGCRNEWLHKKKNFKNHNLQIILSCEFTTNYFQLIITINQISSKKEIVREIIMKTEPDEILFEKMFKDILIENDEIIVTDSSDGPRVIINIEDLYSNQFKYQILGDKEIKEILSYKL